MARLTNKEVDNMKKKIMDDLYSKIQIDLDQRKKKLVTKNRDVFFKKHQPYIDKLPENIFQKTYKYRLNISYPWDRVEGNNDRDTACCNFDWWQNYEEDAKLNYINEKWEINFKDREINVGDYDNLDPDLKEEAGKICKDLLNLIREKANMGLYLEKSIESNRTHKKLRGVWPSSLQKYIPIEPKIGRSKNTEAVKVDTPNFLNERLTINLLEDN